MDKSAKHSPAKAGGEFFADPDHPTHRRYEALRAYLLEGLTAGQVADRFDYTEATVRSLARDFRAGGIEFFLDPKPGPKSAPAKEAARDQVIEWRRRGHSIDEISQALEHTDTPLNRTGVAEIVAEEGFEPLTRRPEHARGLPVRHRLERTAVLDPDALEGPITSRFAGLALAIPDLVELDLPGLVADAGYPGTEIVPATSYLLSLLALKLIGLRRVGHVDDVAHDPGLGIFAGLTSIPKTTALRTYSYRTAHPTQVALLSGLSQAMVAAGLADGTDFDLDFHAIQHWGQDPALDKHYVPKRSQRTRSVLTFFAQDADTHNLIYANAEVSKPARNREVLAFCDYWRDLSGQDPEMLVFDQKLTTQQVLGELDARGVTFMTLRMRSRPLLEAIDGFDEEAWRRVRLERPGAYTRPQVVDQPSVALSSYPGTVRQLVVTGLGRDAPTVIITNDRDSSAKQLIERYARRATIEQRLAEAIQAFHLDALSSAVALNVDLDVVLTVLAGAVCAALRRRLPGYESATPDLLQRRFLDTPGTIQPDGDTIVVHLDRRAYSPVLRAADLPDTDVPWWNGRTLHFEFA